MKKCLYFCCASWCSRLMAVPGASAADIVSATNSPPILPGSGTFVMYDPAGDKYIVYNEPQSKKRLSPCSTFKFTTRSSAWKPAYWTRRCIHAVQMERDAILFPLLEPRSYPGIGHRESVVLPELAAHRPGTDAGIYR